MWNYFCLNSLNPIKIAEKIIDTIYPQICPICEQKPEVISLCDNCAKMYISGQKAFVSNEIISENLTQILAIDDFNPQIRKVLHNLKYNGIEKYAADIIRLGVTPFYDELKKSDIVTSVPLHPLRLLRRGYNQAEILAKVTKNELQIPYENLLFRTRYNLTQTKKNAEKRKKAVIGLFAMKKNKNISGKTILIIDDVCTTSATISECVKILYENKAKKVIILCLARA